MFTGKISRNVALNYLKEAEIFVMTSDNETFGLAYLEAAAKSCAIIAKRYTGIYEWLEENEEALFADSKEELFVKMKRLIDNKELRISLARAAYNRVAKDLTWDKQISKYIDQYEKLFS